MFHIFLLTDAEMFTQQLPHQYLVEPTVQLPREERANGGSMLLQLAHYLAPHLPQKPLQEVLDGAEHTRGVTAIKQLLVHLYTIMKKEPCCVCVLFINVIYL